MVLIYPITSHLSTLVRTMVRKDEAFLRLRDLFVSEALVDFLVFMDSLEFFVYFV